jgi:hypothetical protein
MLQVLSQTLHTPISEDTVNTGMEAARADGAIV